ncbi:hypothetical protein AMTRI_Chr08g209530 [Amborella trichopoda]
MDRICRNASLKSFHVFFFFLTLFCLSKPGDALLAAKAKLVDPTNVLGSWDPNVWDYCTWFHITCDDSNQIIRIDLGMHSLSGTLAPELGSLKSLQNLELYKNNLTGNIPEELGGLTSLQNLDLFNNMLTGSIPQSLTNLKSLLFLRLNSNKLTGRVPQGLRDSASSGKLKVL